MSAYFELLKLGSDFLLVSALVFLCYRLLATGSLSGKTTQLMILEASLKGLIKDAEAAGRSLNEELHRRQTTLERTLADLQSYEKKISAIQEHTNKQANDLDAKLRAVTMLVNKGSFGTTASTPPEREEAPEPPSFESIAPRPEIKRPTPQRGLSDQIEKAVVPLAESIKEVSVEITKKVREVELRDELESENSGNDTRLGVLASMKRQVQTL